MCETQEYTNTETKIDNTKQETRKRKTKDTAVTAATTTKKQKKKKNKNNYSLTNNDKHSAQFDCKIFHWRKIEPQTYRKGERAREKKESSQPFVLLFSRQRKFLTCSNSLSYGNCVLAVAVPDLARCVGSCFCFNFAISAACSFI